MLTQVEVRNDHGAVLALPLQDISAGYLIKSIDGLDPVKAAIVSSSFALLDGEQYQYSSRSKRNIVLTIEYSMDYVNGSVQDLRRRLYSVFMPKTNLNFTFFDSDTPPVNISGMVESCETALFTKTPEVIVSIICFDPDFVDPKPVIFAGGTVIDGTEVILDYQGTVDTGVIFEIPSILSAISGLTIYNRAPDGTLRSFEYAGNLIALDDVVINTIPGLKSVSISHANIIRSGLAGVAPYSNWVKIYPGLNNIRVHADQAAMPYTIEYTNKYGGL